MWSGDRIGFLFYLEFDVVPGLGERCLDDSRLYDGRGGGNEAGVRHLELCSFVIGVGLVVNVLKRKVEIIMSSFLTSCCLLRGVWLWQNNDGWAVKVGCIVKRHFVSRHAMS